jgi:polyribonucleotide 5'-hydroxyl-kinase
VDPSGPAHITRLLNTVLAVVQLVPGDRIKKDKPAEDVKQEVKEEAKPEVEADGDEGVDQAMPEVEDEEEVPFKEEIGWREVTGFIVM